MNNNINFNGWFDSLLGIKKETKDEITKKYIQGVIDKDEFIRRMKQAEN